MRTLIALLLLGSATPALAQHAGHTMPMPKPTPTASPKLQPKPAPTPAKKTAVPVKKAAPAQVKPIAAKPKPVPVAAPKTGDEPDHRTMDHSAMDAGQESSEAMDHSQMDHSQTDQVAMPMQPVDHSTMDMAGDEMGGMTAPMADETPPPEAGRGPARAADAIWGADAMRGSRKQLATENGGMNLLWVMSDRTEYRVRDGKDGYLWDAQGFYGGDIDKLWFKTEGEGSFGERIESAETQALWSHAIAPFFDFQAGVRQDFAPRDRTYAVVGIQGLAPYLFEIDAAAFLSDRGDLTARIEAEYDQRITQRVILQPRAELNLAAQDVPELGIGAGLDTAEFGVRLRYEFAREFAPYIGIEQEWKGGQSARYARAAGEDPSVTNYVVGIRFWF